MSKNQNPIYLDLKLFNAKSSKKNILGDSIGRDYFNDDDLSPPNLIPKDSRGIAEILVDAIINDGLKNFDSNIDQKQLLAQVVEEYKIDPEALQKAVIKGKNDVSFNGHKIPKEMTERLDDLMQGLAKKESIYPKIDLEKELAMSPFAKKIAFKKLDEEKNFANPEVSNTTILAYLHEKTSELQEEQRKAVVERLLKDPKPALALEVLDKKGYLTKDDYQKLFTELAKNFPEKDEKGKIVSLVKSMQGQGYSDKLFEAASSITGEKITPHKEIKEKVQKLDLPEVVKKMAENKENFKPYMEKLDIKRHAKVFNEILIPGKLLDPMIVLEKVIKKASTNNKEDPKLVKDFIEKVVGDLPFDQQIAVAEKVRDYTTKEKQWLENPENSLNKNSKESREQKQQRINKSIKEFDEIEKSAIGHIKISDQALNDKIIESLILNKKGEIKDNINYPLLEKVFEAKTLELSEKTESMLSHLSQRAALLPYLDKYIEKGGEDILEAEFNHKAFGKISVQDYKNKQQEITGYIKENKIEEINKLIYPSGKETNHSMFAYVLQNGKEHGDEKFLSTLVSSYIKHDEKNLKNLEPIARILDVEKNPKNLKSLVQGLKGVATKDINNALKEDKKTAKLVNDEIVRKKEKTTHKKQEEEKRLKHEEKLKQEEKTKEQKEDKKVVDSLKSMIKNFQKSKGKDHNDLNDAIVKMQTEDKITFPKDKQRAAQVILEATKGIDLDHPKNKDIAKVFGVYYDKHARGFESSTALDTPIKDNLKKESKALESSFDKIYENIKPKELGKLLFRETYKETRDLQTKTSLVKKEHHEKLEKAVALLQGNINKKDTATAFPVLEGVAKGKAVENLTKNLNLKQMSKVVATVEGYESYSQKNWLSKALTRFADAVSRKFSSFKTKGVKEGLEEIMTKGAKLEKVEKKVEVNQHVNKGNKGMGGRH
jgi:hypothetical protein